MPQPREPGHSDVRRVQHFVQPETLPHVRQPENEGQPDQNRNRHPRLFEALHRRHYDSGSPVKRIDGLVLTVVAVAFVAAKLAIVNVPAYWDETRWVGQAFQLANWPLVSVFPGFRPMEAFAGHPPGIHLVFALAAKIGGSSMRTAHLVTIAFGALGLCF